MPSRISSVRIVFQVAAALAVALLGVGCEAASSVDIRVGHGVGAGAETDPGVVRCDAVGGERTDGSETFDGGGCLATEPVVDEPVIDQPDEPVPADDLSDDGLSGDAPGRGEPVPEPILAPGGCTPPESTQDEPLTLTSSDRPAGAVAHYYDLELDAERQRLYVAGLPGLVIYDIQDGGLERVGQYPIAMMPKEAFDAVKPMGDDLVATVRGAIQTPAFYGGDYWEARLAVMDVSEPAAPQFVSTLTLGDAADVAVHGDQLFVTDPQGQLIVVDASAPTNPVIIAQLPTFQTPRDIAIVDAPDGGVFAYIADLVMGVAVVDITNAASPQVVELVDTLSNPQRLTVDGDILWVSSGAAGFEAFDLTDPALPKRLGSAKTGRAIAGLRASGDLLWTAEHEVITAWDVSDPTAPRRLRSAVTPWVALDVLPVADGEVFVADWEEVQRWHLDDATETPQLEIRGDTLGFPADGIETTLTLHNVGCAPLTISGMEADVPGYEVQLPSTEIAAGSSVQATLIWTGAGAPPSANLCVATDDPAAPVRSVEIEPPAGEDGLGPEIGTQAPDFVLPDIDGNLHALSDYEGQPVLIVLFATWCPVCHFELPDLEKGIWANYQDEGLQILAIGGSGETVGALQEFRTKYDLTFPILFDDGEEILDAYRFIKMGTPGTVPFPQDFVIGPDHRVLWRGDLYEPQVIESVVQDALAL